MADFATFSSHYSHCRSAAGENFQKYFRPFEFSAHADSENARVYAFWCSILREGSSERKKPFCGIAKTAPNEPIAGPKTTCYF
jgi:hypothetical protein